MCMKTVSLGQFFDSSSTALWILSDACSYCFGFAKSSVNESQSNEFQTYDGSYFQSTNSDLFSKNPDSLAVGWSLSNVPLVTSAY